MVNLVYTKFADTQSSILIFLCFQIHTLQPEVPHHKVYPHRLLLAGFPLPDKTSRIQPGQKSLKIQAREIDSSGRESWGDSSVRRRICCENDRSRLCVELFERCKLFDCAGENGVWALLGHSQIVRKQKFPMLKVIWNGCDKNTE